MALLNCDKILLQEIINDLLELSDNSQDSLSGYIIRLENILSDFPDKERAYDSVTGIFREIIKCLRNKKYTNKSVNPNKYIKNISKIHKKIIGCKIPKKTYKILFVLN